MTTQSLDVKDVGPMSQRRRLDPAVRKELILDAAADAFGERGYEATRVEDIASEAGIAKGLIYRHFPTKEDLFRALMERKGRRCAEGLRAHLEEHLDHDRDRDGFLRAALASWVSHVAEDFSDGSWIGDRTYEENTQPYHDAIRAVIVEAITARRPDVEPHVARLVAAALEGAVEVASRAWARDEASVVSREELLEILVSFCAGGMDGAWTCSPSDR